MAPLKWSKCNPQGQPIFVSYLARLLTHEDQLGQLFGAEIESNKRGYFDALLAFARKEQADYGFKSPEDFTLARFERAMEERPNAMDFWLMLCVAFDMGNYLDDYEGK
jgi:hypothetical protein